MGKVNHLRPNCLGDLRAEADQEMLGQAFLETGDYRSLIETSDRIIVVGRRGTGKSALALRLEDYWKKNTKTKVIRVTPEEHQVIGIRPIVKLFGNKFNLIRAGSRIIWRYVLMMESALHLSTHYKFAKIAEQTALGSHLNKWRSLPENTTEKVRIILQKLVHKDSLPESIIADLPHSIELNEIERALSEALDQLKIDVVFLVDRLDEGYEPDDIGVGFLNGLIQATIDLKTKFPNIKPIVFMRDNIFRSVQKTDPDYSRNIEGHVLRLHWDDTSLFNFAALRLKFVLNIDREASLKIWDRCVAGELKGKDGFKTCLKLTLYRPRDLIALLNEAFFLAGKDYRVTIILDDLKHTAKSISQNRLDDLKKEYTAVLPGLPEYIGAFHGKNPQQAVNIATDSIQTVLSKGSKDPLIQQDFFIFQDAQQVLRGLYSVGFLGIKELTTGSFVFCHDGKAPDREFTAGDQILVHPCYWSALNCTEKVLDSAQAEEIYDEYEIEVSSETPAIRKKIIKGLISELASIPEGSSGATNYEKWCYKAIRICFAKGLRNVELKANKLAKARRDVVATNLGEGDVWSRIFTDYGTRQVTFEVKNYKGLVAQDYHQIQSYLTGGYGRLAFFVTRDDSVDLYAGKDVEWVRELYGTHKVLVVKLTAKYLCNLLNKLCNPQKHDDVNNSIHKLLDNYERLYVAGQSATAKKHKKRHKKKHTG